MRRVRCQPAWVSRQIASGHGLLSTGRSPSVTDLAEVELAKFVAAPGQPRASDPLTWWHDNMARFPLLSAAARRYLAALAMSVPSERLFSSAGETTDSFLT